jgi:hypothetical protein
MAKRSKRGAKASPKFRKAYEALDSVPIRHQVIGRTDEDGNVHLDLNELEQLKKELGKKGGALSRVRFVALNAPFKRRGPILPT